MCILICNLSLCAQTDEQILPSEVEETIKQQCIYKIKTLKEHLAIIASKEVADSIKDYHIEACLDLFVGRGNDIKDHEGNISMLAPRIEVSSLTTGELEKYSIKNYLVRLKESHYSKIIFEVSSLWFEGGIKNIGENLHSASVSFDQVFIGYNGDSIVYRDKTKKKVKILIEKMNLENSYTILLGDINTDASYSY